MGQMCLDLGKHQNTNGICIKACMAKGDGILSPRKNMLYSNNRTYNIGQVIFVKVLEEGRFGVFKVFSKCVIIGIINPHTLI